MSLSSACLVLDASGGLYLNDGVKVAQSFRCIWILCDRHFRGDI
jgi:hypothetical protein